MSVLQWVLLLAALVVFFWAVGAYNRLVRLRNGIANAFGQIDVQLKRRHDLIPNLVEVARKYLEHQARSAEQAASGAPLNPALISTLSGAEQMLGGALGRLMAVVEDYPELKADQNMRELSEELSSTENRIGFARQAYNDQANDYNDAAQQFPTLIVARLFNFQPQSMLESTTSEAERQPVKVQF
jgi:LemA protein